MIEATVEATPVLPLPLLGLFRALQRAGVGLGTRDYLDALRALQAGHGGTARADLARLAEALWARGPEETVLVRRWFADLPPLPAATRQALDGQDAATRALAAGDAATTASASAARRGRAGEIAPDVVVAAAEAPVEGARTRIALGGAHAAGGLMLPHLIAEPVLGDDLLLEPQPLVPLRQLVVLWRRYRRATRARGPRTELDLDATVRQRCERGLIGAPVLRPRRRNAARLLVLADASPSMTPWLPFLHLMQQSLAYGRLGEGTLRWFGNVPRRQVHASARLNSPESRDDLLDRHSGASVLVVSDAGSARGLLNRRRWTQTQEFVATAAARCGCIVWMNPMPPARWTATTAALVAADPRVTMLPLDAAHLLRAVDLLRGHK